MASTEYMNSYNDGTLISFKEECNPEHYLTSDFIRNANFQALPLIS